MTTRKMMTALALVLSMATQQAVAGEWHYTDTDNKIGERVLVAFVTATNQINLDAPYAGSQNPILVIRSTDNWLNVSVKIGKGQILCDTYSHTKIRVRFDAGKPITVGCERPSDGDSTMVFLGNVTRLVGAIKSAKKMVVEIVLYQNGNQYAEFERFRVYL